MGIVGWGERREGGGERRLVGVDMGNGRVGESWSWSWSWLSVCKLRPRHRMGMRVELEGY